MENTENHNIKSSFFTQKKRLLSSLIILLMLTACGNREEKSPVNAEAPAGSPASGNTAGTVQPGTQQQSRVAILIRGNEWISGIPGLKDNSFSALTGIYRIRAAGTGESKAFSVYLSSEPIFFNNEWQLRSGTGSVQVHQLSTSEGFIAAATLDDGKGTVWTAVFVFPLGLESSALSNEDFNQMLRVWSNRLLYFLSLAKTTGEISIPAVVEF